MSSAGGDVLAWPALAGGPLPQRISYERGIWGKLNGARADYKWIATTPSFTVGGVGLERELQLGSEDAPRRAAHWRSLGELGLAVSCYLSRSVDAVGRTSFLEKQVFAWRRRDDTPAALGALVLLPRVARTDAAIWWDRRTQSWSEDDDSTLILTPEDHEPLRVDLQELAATAAAGLAELGRTASEEALTLFYAHLLAGHRGVSLGKLEAPLSPEAVAGLLLPLPRSLADSLSVAGWLPSQRIPDPEALRRCWNAALGGLALPPPQWAEVPRELVEQARPLAQSVLAGDPTALSPRPVRPASSPGRDPLQIALWGTSSAGKTALLCQLYLGNLVRAGSAGDPDGEWESFPSGEESQKFFDHMRALIRSEHFFPPHTVTAEPIEYIFRHRRTRVEVVLRLEDRPGLESEDPSEDMLRHLTKADGLLLLFDHTAQGTKLHSRLWKTLEKLRGGISGEGGPIYDRPIAACLSKADLLIHTVEDLQMARADWKGFVRRHDRMGLEELIAKFCSNYQLIPVSAAGLRVEYGVVQSMVFYDENLKPRLAPGGNPLNVTAPFSWLLGQLASRS